jgi:hypothetical protein
MFAYYQNVATFAENFSTNRGFRWSMSNVKPDTFIIDLWLKRIRRDD